MNNKGFTLVELLAVIVILTSISLVVVTSISSSLEKREEKELQEQIELAIGAAKIYFSLNDVTCVDIQTLKDNDYFSSDKKTSRLNMNYTISLNDVEDKYVYSDTMCLD